MLLVTLLGRPGLTVDGLPVPGPRSQKAWALLAYLVANGAVPRDRLVSLLFPDAEDGRAALRWNLAHLRRVLDRPHALTGDPVHLALGPDTRVDVHLLAVSPWYEVVDRLDLGAPLLEGASFPDSPGFHLWLDGERRWLAGLGATALREAARAETAEGNAAAAVRHARQLVELQPWDENGHELLVRALARTGDVPAARAHVRFVTGLFLRELGRPPSAAVAAAAEPVLDRPVVGSRVRTVAQLRAGTTAVAAGAAAAGIDSLRRAVSGARVLGDAGLLVRALTTLGGAQVHAVRGADESAVAALREAVAVAERTGHPELATTACRELAYVEFLRCRMEAAERWLDRAVVTVGADDAERAWIEVIRGSLRSDAGRHAEAFPILRGALRQAEEAGEHRAAAMALTHLGRLHVLRAEDAEALVCLTRAQRLAEDAGWLSFLPYPVSWAAEVRLRTGAVTEAADLFGQAHALAVEAADPCWESLAGRGLGLVAAARGDHEGAARLLHDAPVVCRRQPDAYVWVEAYALSAQAAHAVARSRPRADELIDELDRLASAHGLRDFQAEAALLRVVTDRAGAWDAAEGEVGATDNPVLADRLAQLRGDAAGAPPSAVPRPRTPSSRDDHGAVTGTGRAGAVTTP